MSEPQILTKLHDIQLPLPISWWPIAPGWYLLMALGLIFFVVLFSIVRRSLENGRAKRQALQLLATYEQEYQSQANSQLSSMRVSELLRRVALAYFPREQVASLQGEAWINFLNNSSKGIDFKVLQECLVNLPYQLAKTVDLKPLFHYAKIWIKQRSVPCSN